MARAQQKSFFKRLSEAAQPFFAQLAEELRDYDWRPHLLGPARSCRKCFEEKHGGQGAFLYAFEDAGACCHCGEMVGKEVSVAVPYDR